MNYKPDISAAEAPQVGNLMDGREESIPAEAGNG